MRFLRLAEVIHLTQLSRSTIYAGMKDETFPHSVKLGKRSVAWTEDSIIGWMTEKVNALN